MNTQTNVDVDVADEMSSAPLGRLHKWLGVMQPAQWCAGHLVGDVDVGLCVHGVSVACACLACG